MEPTKIAFDATAPHLVGASTAEAHVEALLKGYRADRIAVYHGTIGLPLKQATEYADADTEKQRAAMMEKLEQTKRAARS